MVFLIYFTAAFKRVRKNKITGKETKIYDVNSQIQETGVMIFPLA